MKVARVILIDGKEIEIEVEQIEAITISDVADEVPVPEQPIPVVAEEVVPDTPAPEVMEAPVFEDVPTTSEEVIVESTEPTVEMISTPDEVIIPIRMENPSEPVSDEVPSDALDDIVNLVMSNASTVSTEAVEGESNTTTESMVEETPVEEEPKKEEPSVDFVGA